MKNIVIIGATSAVAQAFARRVPLASFVLVGRSRERLEAVAADLRARGSDARIHVIDVAIQEVCQLALKEASEQIGPIDLVLIAQGSLVGPQDEAVSVSQTFRTNAVDVAEWMYAALSLFEERGSGKLAVFSSVAADRGRASNALYGAAKSAVSTLIEGLRQRYTATPGIAIYDFRPGPIDTPMTSGMKKTPLFSTADRVGQGALDALRSKPKGGVIYLPGWWRWIMLVIRLLPEAIFFKTKF